MGERRINEDGLRLIQQYEGLRLGAYLCPAGVWTIGYGHTGPDVHEGLTITEAEAEVLLRGDLAVAEACIEGAVSVPLTDNQFGALVSWAYNVGCGNVRRSTLRTRLNGGHYNEVPRLLTAWAKAGGRTMPGLLLRRGAEGRMWLAPDRALS